MGEHRIGVARGRPHVPLKDHPFKMVLACIDAMTVGWGISRQRATLLATSVFFAEGVEPIAAADLPEKLRRVYDEHGGFGMAYTMPAAGDPDGKNIKEKMQSVDTLSKMDKRYSTGTDLEYRTALSTLVYLVMFHRGRADERHTMIDALMHRLNDPDPQIHELAGQLLE
jgi:hypothetical protein